MKTKVISKRGGARPGAGRKPKLQHEARELFNAAIDERWDQILLKIDEWIAKGDKDILRLVIEQRIGRASQNIELKKTEQKHISMAIFFDPRVQQARQRLDSEIAQVIREDVVQEVALVGGVV
jgi:hypothetical protein